MLRRFVPLLAGAASSVLLAQAAAPAPGSVPPDIQDFVEVHCLDCHSGAKAKAGLDLGVPPVGDVDRLWRWSRLRERVHSFEMPPVTDSEVTAAERAEFAQWVDALLSREVPQLPLDPGDVTVRRLSRGQWCNSVRDLFGVSVDTAGFPADDLGYGFDSIGDALTFSTLHLENYLAASAEVAVQVFHGEDPAQPSRRLFQAEAMRLVDDRGASMGGGVAHMFTNATIEQFVDVPRDGQYRLHVVASGQQAGDEPAKMRPALDGKQLAVIEVANREPKEFVIDVVLPRGRHSIALSFINDFYDPKNSNPERRDRNLGIDTLEVVGPVDALPDRPEQQWLRDAQRGSSDDARLSSMLAAMLPRLWRRAVAKDELQRLRRAGAARLKAGESLLEVQRFVLTVALTSPHFLFRMEGGGKEGQQAALTGAEIAARLSYFLWASTPDESLSKLAAGKQLQDPEVLVAQVDRMLLDARAESLATDFAAQWFELRALAQKTPDPDRFPGFDGDLRAAMRRESELLFWSVLKDGRDVRVLLDSDYTFVNQRLAQFYGLPHEGDPEAFERTVLVGDQLVRGGLLGHASMHAITSNPTRTSPVKRGKWLLENLLGQAPPPPPPGNDSFADEAAIDDSATLRQQMAQHRERSACAVCHVRMDALGLAMERFDGIGRFRDRDAAGAIDASGELPDGRKLDGLASLKRVLAADPAFVRTVLHKLFVYAIGRDLRPVDRLRVDLAVRQLLAAGPVTLRDLILAVVRDPAFAQRATGS